MARIRLYGGILIYAICGILFLFMNYMSRKSSHDASIDIRHHSQDKLQLQNGLTIQEENGKVTSHSRRNKVRI